MRHLPRKGRGNLMPGGCAALPQQLMQAFTVMRLRRSFQRPIECIRANLRSSKGRPRPCAEARALPGALAGRDHGVGRDGVREVSLAHPFLSPVRMKTYENSSEITSARLPKGSKSTSTWLPTSWNRRSRRQSSADTYKKHRRDIHKPYIKGMLSGRPPSKHHQNRCVMARGLRASLIFCPALLPQRPQLRTRPCGSWH